MKRLLIALALLWPAAAAANPSLSSYSGTAAYGATLTFLGTNFGLKPNQQKTYCFANFDDISAGVACTTWSAVTAMGDIQNVQVKTTGCLEGAGCVGIGAIDIGLSKNNTANVSMTDVGVGGRFYWSWGWTWPSANSAAYPANNINWKTFRAWPPSVGTQNDIYGGQQIDGGFVYDTESHDFNITNGVDKVFATAIRPPIGVWQQIVMYNQLNSDAATSQTDGDWKTLAQGVQTMHISTWRSNTAADAANGRYQTIYPIHMVMANNSFPAGGDFRFDNILVETSYCLVWVTTTSTNIDTATRYYLVVQTWADGTITAVWAQNAFVNGQTVYAYVQDSNALVNPSGLAVVVAASSGGGGNPPPPGPDTGQCPCLP